MGPATRVDGGRGTRPRARSRAPRYLVAIDDQPRVRRASDVTTVVVGAALIVWAVTVQQQASGAGSTASSLPALPAWVISTLHLVNTATLLFTAAVVIVLARAPRVRPA